MRFAAIADVHGNTTALVAVLDDIRRKGIADIVNLGDALSGPLDPAGTAEMLMARDFPTVLGNHDEWLIDRPPEEMGDWEAWSYPELDTRHLDWIRALPRTLSWNGVFLCHATPRSNAENWLDRRGDGILVASPRARVARHLSGVSEPLVLCGHTHVPRVVRVGGQVIANPGSVGCPAYLDDRGTPPFIGETGAPDARYAVFERVDGQWRTELCTVPYDPTEMARLAREKGAPSWAVALETGWFTPAG